MANKVLIIGSGGREHALVWKIKEQHPDFKMYCAPGNAGIAQLAELVDIKAEDIPGLVAKVKEIKPDLTVVGPEVPLCEGLTDKLEAEGYKVFGPSKSAAQLEGSKAFAKEVMYDAKVPTAAYHEFMDLDRALNYVGSLRGPFVIKYDALAAGKGVIICKTIDEGKSALNLAFDGKTFGPSGKVLVEEFLEGEEASVIGLVDGTNISLLVSSQDHKRAYDNDEGPNTGGMGAYSHAAVVTPELMQEIKDEIFFRTVNEMARRGTPFKGALYAGLMINNGKPKVLEFNCRFGDPETQVILPPVTSDFYEALLACSDGTLKNDSIKSSDEKYVCITMASGGYPGPYAKGKVISGLEEAAQISGLIVFHAGTKMQGDQTVTNGGRVLGITGKGNNFEDAIRLAYEGVGKIRWENEYHRNDIAKRALNR